MRKFLSLVLALAMAMSLVVVNTSAKEFTDDDELNYEEAVAVISEIGVVDGYADGSFKPQNGLTRGAAAKIICNLILGPTTAAELHADTRPFKDVAIDSEFAGYIAYCAQQGIISGYADGEFKAGNPLTGYAFMKMLLGALGYDTEIEKFVGENWSINVAKQALGIGLNAGLVDEFNGVDYVTREEAALYAFNTLKATMVDYENKISANVNGAEVVISNNTAKPVTWSEGRNNDGNIKEDTFVQFAEEYFPDLVRRDDSTKFMEPANTWLYDKTEIGTYERRDLIVETYTTGVTGRDLYDLLKAGVIKENDLEVYVDGVDKTGVAVEGFDKVNLVRSNTENVGSTGNGVLTKVYLDTDKDLITVVSINTWLAQATGDYSESKEYAPLKVFTGKDQTASYNVDVEDVKNVVDVTNETYYQVNISYKDVNRGEIVVINDVEILEDSTVTKYSASDRGDGTGAVTKLTTGGEEYSANKKAFYDKDVLYKYNENLLTDNTYNVYLDQYGYFLGVDLFEGAKNYVFITGYDRPTSNLSVKTADAAAIFLDGSMKQIKVDVKDTNENIKDAAKLAYGTPGYFTQWSDANGGEYAHNRWYTYTVDNNGTYTLKPAVRMTATNYKADTTVNTANLRVNDNVKAADQRANVYGEDATVFLTVDLDEVDTTLPLPTTKRAITDVTGVYTGVQEVDIEIDAGTEIEEAEIYTVYDSDYYIIAAIVVGEGKGNNANIAYLIDGAKSEEYRDGVYYWEFECVMDGKVQTLTARSEYLDTIRALRNDADGIVELRFDGDYVVNVKDVDDIYGNSEFDVLDTDGVNPKYSTADYDVYDVTAGNELTLQGRTLYVLANRQDMGLALTSSAAAVVIQPENNKQNVKTEFSTVAGALSHLADANPSATGLQYNGRIIAALDNTGAAAWVLFISKTPLTTGAQGGGVTNPGVTVSLSGTTVTVKTEDKVLQNPSEVLDEIKAYFEGLGLVVGTPYLTGTDTWAIPTFYNVGGYQIPAQVYTYDQSTGLTQEITYYVNGDYTDPQKATVGATIGSELATKGTYVDDKTTLTAGNTTKLESGKNYTLYSKVTTANGSEIGVVGTSVAAQNPSFLKGNWVKMADSSVKKVADLKFEAANQTVTDGLYEVDVDGVKTYVPTGTSVAVTADYAKVNGEIAARGSIVVGTKDLKVEDGYYGRNFTVDVDDFINASVSTPVALSTGKIFVDKDGNIYGSDGETFQVTVNLGAGFLAKSTAKLTATDNLSSTNADMNLTGLTSTAAVTDSGNEVSFTAGSTNTGSIVVTFTLNAGATNYTLTAVNS